MGTALRAESYSVGARRHNVHRKRVCKRATVKETQLVEEARGAGNTTKLTDIIIKLNVNTKNGSG